jgi:small subunit ribosomal protein S6
MNKYEMMFIVKATMDSDKVKSSAENIKKIAESNKAKVVDFKELGERKLAYTIKNEINGYYYVMTMQASKEAVAEIDRKASIDETIIRHLIIKTVRENTLLNGHMVFRSGEEEKKEEVVEEPGELIPESSPEEIDKSIDNLVIV